MGIGLILYLSREGITGGTRGEMCKGHRCCLPVQTVSRRHIGLARIRKADTAPLLYVKHDSGAPPKRR
jgi:hypothetical protein